jgi:hypothetical protein
VAGESFCYFVAGRRIISMNEVSTGVNSHSSGSLSRLYNFFSCDSALNRSAFGVGLGAAPKFVLCIRVNTENGGLGVVFQEIAEGV